MKKCQYCGNEIDDVLSYCPNCGAVLTDSIKGTSVVCDSYSQSSATPDKCFVTRDSNKNKNIIVIVLVLIVGLFVGGLLMHQEQKTKQVANNSNNYEIKNDDNASSCASNNNANDASSSEPDGVSCQINGTHVNMREYPNMKAQVIFQFPGYETVRATEKTAAEDGKYPWYKISYNGYVGWVYGQFVK